MLVLGVSNYTVAGHTWISHRVAYRWRARSFGFFEMSWALALLLGAPIVAALINRFGWRGPFVALAIAAAVAVARRRLEAAERRSAPRAAPPSRPAPTATRSRPSRDVDVHPDGALSDLHRRPPLTADRVARRVRLGTDGARRHVGLRDLGELARRRVRGLDGRHRPGRDGPRCGGAAGQLDHRRLRRSHRQGAQHGRRARSRSGSGSSIIVSAGDATAVGVIGLLVFLLGFEYGFVTSLSLTSEAMPDARGATLAISNAVGTLARGGGTIAERRPLRGVRDRRHRRALRLRRRRVAVVLPGQPANGSASARKLTIAALTASAWVFGPK